MTAGTNWSGNYRYEALRVHEPTTVAELQEVVATADHVKALGTRHSFNDVADSHGGVLVYTGGLELDITVDRDRRSASVPAGLSYSAVIAELESHGVALENLGSLPHISVGGATATGTHGSGDTNRVLAAAISEIEFVDADGSLRTVDRSSPDLAAMAVGLGAFGVMTRLTLDVEPSYLVRQDIYRGATWETVLENLDEVMASAYSVNLHADFSSEDTRGIWQKSRVDVNAAGDPIPRDVPDSLWGADRSDGLEMTPPGKHTAIGTPGPWSERLAHFTPSSSPSAGGDELQTEYFVQRRDAVAAIRALRSMGDRIDPHLHGTEIRTVAADDLWLSPCVGQDCLSIGFTWRKHPVEVVTLLPHIEAALAPFEPRPHWGKLFAIDRETLHRRFARLADFVELTKAYDPSGKFSNRFLRRLEED